MREIPLSRGYVALVDDEDYEALVQVTWHANKPVRGITWYARTNLNLGGFWRGVMMHRVILAPPKDMTVDHINGNGLDNRRKNLRIATRAQNRCNSRGRPAPAHGYHGVRYLKGVRTNCWAADICSLGVTHYLGVFPSAISAARAYDDAARRLHGEFARLNFQNDSTPPSTDVVPDVHVALGAGA